MKNVSDQSCRENQNTHFVFGEFFSENVTVYEKMWENNSRACHSTDNMAHARCMLDN
jgi:hypothetical protein